MAKKILIVDDEEEIRLLLQKQFQKLGFACSIALDGVQALELARRHKPDIIILDLKLPRLSGEEVCRELKRDESLCGIPIIMLTAKGSDSDRVIGKVIGAVHYLTKPCTSEEVIAAVSKALDEVAKT